MSEPQRVSVNLNDNVYFRLTDKGRAFVRDYFEDLYRHDPDEQRRARQAAEGVALYEKGYTQLHDFMLMFGPAMTSSYGPQMFEDGSQIEIGALP